MTIPLYALLAFACWTLLVVLLGLGIPRVGSVLMGKAKPSDFPADTPHGGERYRRTMRAHANCVENLPAFAAVVLTGEVAGVHSSTLDTLAIVYMAARVCQTITHIASGRNRAINIRFGFFVTQLGCVLTMVVLILLRG